MIRIREVTDMDELRNWRMEVISNVFGVEANKTLIESNTAYYQRHIVDGSHIAIIAAVDGADAGCGAICLSDELPSPDNPSGKCAYMMNIYVRDKYRGHGVGHAIVSGLVDKAKSLGCGKIYLETTGMARNLYLTSGFTDLKDMMIYEKTDF